MKKSTKITIIAMSLVIALLIAAVGVLWYSLNTAETFANRSRTDIALGKYEILRDRSASPEKFLEAAKAKDYDIIIFSKEQTLALGEKIKELFPDGNADSRRLFLRKMADVVEPIGRVIDFPQPARVALLLQGDKGNTPCKQSFL